MRKGSHLRRSLGGHPLERVHSAKKLTIQAASTTQMPEPSVGQDGRIGGSRKVEEIAQPNHAALVPWPPAAAAQRLVTHTFSTSQGTLSGT